MIYTDQKQVSELQFQELLERTRTEALSALSSSQRVSSLSGDSFEAIVHESAVKAAVKSPFEGHIIRTGAHGFPDIIAKRYYGIEVKLTIGDKWVSTGNSVLESTRIEDVETIYIMFGKVGGSIDIKYRLYQECLYDIGVTHSPRYKIDMLLEKGKSIFDKMGVSYDTLRKSENPISFVKKYYKGKLQEGEELWWIDNTETPTLASPIIKPYRNLTEDLKKAFIIESMGLFPELFGNSTMKFERTATYLVTRYNAISSNVRDIFTAGGKIAIELDGIKYLAPRIFLLLLSNKSELIQFLEDADSESLKQYWKIEELPQSRIGYWKDLLSKITVELDGNTTTVLQMFECGKLIEQETT